MNATMSYKQDIYVTLQCFIYYEFMFILFCKDIYLFFRLMIGFMLPTMFLSMWISNTATTAMMVPIVDAVLKELEKGPKSSPTSDSTIS